MSKHVQRFSNPDDGRPVDRSFDFKHELGEDVLVQVYDDKGEQVGTGVEIVAGASTVRVSVSVPGNYKVVILG